MKSAAFLPRLAAYFVGLPVLVVIYLIPHLSTQVFLPLFVVALFVGIGGQARIRQSYPQDFSKREEWVACGIFALLGLAALLSFGKW
ncbi:hypothetical protein [Hymenobacter sp.]|jgi:hypothetical protein|uniref:hypothetical protein n=1 Tax=Hymenobacter sp. TaxID=1898978 RepID=UPI002ED94A7C